MTTSKQFMSVFSFELVAEKVKSKSKLLIFCEEGEGKNEFSLPWIDPRLK